MEIENGGAGNLWWYSRQENNVCKTSWSVYCVDGCLLEKFSFPCRKRQYVSASGNKSGDDDDDYQDQSCAKNS